MNLFSFLFGFAMGGGIVALGMVGVGAIYAGERRRQQESQGVFLLVSDFDAAQMEMFDDGEDEQPEPWQIESARWN